MSTIHKQLHKLEEELIQICGLMKALQQLLPDGSAHGCVTNALEEKLEALQQHFYMHWELLHEE